MNEYIHIGTVKVPLLDYAIGGAAILGIRDSGKTVTAKGIAEQLIDHGIPIIVFDAVGKWRWMKVPGTEASKPKGYKIVVAGGRAGDLPLTPQSVGEIVRAALKERIPLVIDLYDPKLSKADWRRIVQTAIRIIHYENEGGPVHVFLEEAAEYVPQKVNDGETYAEVEKFARMGGNASCGITLINQRSQEVNKAVLDLCTTLILGCQIGSRAIEAVEKWVDRLDPKTADAVTQSLPKLQSGEAWVWTRQNPDRPERERIPFCRSLHPDRRTPDVVLKAAKGIDPAEFVERLAISIPKVIEQANANDPVKLHQRIRELERAANKAPAPSAPLPPVQVPVFSDEDRRVLDSIYARCSTIETELNLIKPLKATIERWLETLRSTRRTTQPDIRHSVIPKTAADGGHRVGNRQSREDSAMPGNGDLPTGEKAILIACAQFNGCTREELTTLTGYKRSSRDAYVQRLSVKNFVRVMEKIYPTPEGESALGDYERLPEGAELAKYWMNRLPEGERVILAMLLNHGGNTVARDDISEQTGLKRSSRDAYIQRMNAKRIVSITSTGVAAHRMLFD